MARTRPKNADDTEAHLRICVGCHNTTRPSWMLKREAPGTLVRASADRCVTCYQQVMKDKPSHRQEKPLTPEEEAKQEQRYDHNVTALTKFMERRNQRLNRRVLNEYRGNFDGGFRHPRDADCAGGADLGAGASQSRREA